MSLAVSDIHKRQEMPELRPIVTVREILTIVFRHRFAILLAGLLPPIAAVGLLIWMPKVYQAQADILVKTGREYLASGADSSAASGPTSTKQEDINSEITLLNSRAVAQATIDAIGLRNLYPDLVDNPPTSSSLSDAAVTRFKDDLGVEPVKMSNIISVTFAAPDPHKAEAILNKLVAVYIAKHTQVFAGQRAEGYEDSIRTTLADIDRLEAQKTKVKLDNGIYDIAAQRAALITQRVDGQAHLQEVVNNTATLKQRLEYLLSVRSQVPAMAQSTNTDKSDEAVHAREAMIDLRQQEAAVSARYGADNPDLKRIRAQIATLQQTLAGTSNSRVSTAATPSPLRQQIEQEIVMDTAQLAPLDAEHARYNTLLTTIGDELARLETADLSLRTTTSRIDALTDNFKALQARYQQARTEEQTDLAKQVSVVQVNPAISPDKPAKPKKLIYGGAGLLAGILSAAAVAIAFVLTNGTVVSEESIERLVGLPVLTSVQIRSRRVGPPRIVLD